MFISLYRGIRIMIFKRKKTSKVIPGAASYFFKGGKTGVLLIHGFSSSPDDFRYLREYLKEKNISVYAPLLPGHGTRPGDLLKTHWEDWLDASNKGLKKLRKHCSKIYVGGSSAGGNLAFLVASKNKVEGLLSFSTPVIHKRKRWIPIVLPILNRLKVFQKKRSYQGRTRKIIKAKSDYKKFPISKSYDVLKIMKMTNDVISRIKVPSLILQSSEDAQLGEDNAEYIYKTIKSKRKKLFFIPDSYHVFLLDIHRDMAFKEIYKFIKEK